MSQSAAGDLAGAMGILAQLPDVGSVPQPVKYSRGLKKWLELNGKSATVPNLFLWMFYAHMWGFAGVVLDEIKDDWGGAFWTSVITDAAGVAEVQAIGAAPDAGPILVGAAAGDGSQEVQLSLGYSSPPGPPPSTTRDPLLTTALIVFIINSWDVSLKMLLELVSAQQVGKLSAGNINGLMCSYGYDSSAYNFGDAFQPHMAWLATTWGKLINQGPVQGLANSKLWVKYHTTAVSTPALVNRAITELMNHANGVFSAATQTATNNAVAAPWDDALARLIPTQAIAVAALFLKAVGLYPSNKWYQGEKAIAEMSAPFRERTTKYFEKWLSVKSDTSAVSGLAGQAVSDVPLLNHAPDVFGANGV